MIRPYTEATDLALSDQHANVLADSSDRPSSRS